MVYHLRPILSVLQHQVLTLFLLEHGLLCIKLTLNFLVLFHSMGLREILQLWHINLYLITYLLCLIQEACLKTQWVLAAAKEIHFLVLHFPVLIKQDILPIQAIIKPMSVLVDRQTLVN